MSSRTPAGSKLKSSRERSSDSNLKYKLYPDEDFPVNPFIKYDNNNKEQSDDWPSIYDEMDDMLDACCLIYALAELRKMVREGQLDDPSILKLPLTALEVWKVVQSNQQHLKDSRFGNSFYLDLLNVLVQRQQKIVASTGKLISKRLQQHLVAFNDDMDQEEAVYCISVNPITQRITVCFRGSITKMDWSMDEEVYMKTMDNPVPASKMHAGNKLRIHNGFHNYLCTPRNKLKQENGVKKSKEVNDDEPGLSQYQKMLQQHIIPLMKQYPGYKLYVTGHSLGAALATLFAFLAAAEPDAIVSKPVTCVSFGSPYVGDDSFRSAHQTLESLGKLRNLRVSNFQDYITLIPFVSFRWKVWDSEAHVGAFFKHVGVNLRFFASASSSVPFQIIYPRVRSGFLTATCDELMRGWDYSLLANCTWDLADYFIGKNHGVKEYERRLHENMPILQIMYLNELYANKSVVGHLIADF